MLRRLIFLAKRLERLLRYGVVGVGVAAIYSLIVVAIVEGHVILDPTLASAVAFALTQPVAFLAHRKITYPDAGAAGYHWKRFAVLSACGFALTLATMKIVDLLGWPFWIGLMIGWVVIPAMNFIISSIWVFRIKTLLRLKIEDTPGVHQAIAREALRGRPAGDV